MDQIYKTDLNELFSYQRKGEKLEEKEKVIEIEIERLRDFKEHPFHVKDDTAERENTDYLLLLLC